MNNKIRLQVLIELDHKFIRSPGIIILFDEVQCLEIDR